MKIEKYFSMLAMTCLTILVLWIGIAMFGEACDVYNNWTCGVYDDGYQDGEFNWRRGVFPW